MHSAQIAATTSQSLASRWRRWREGSGSKPRWNWRTGRESSFLQHPKECECGCPENEPLLKRVRRQLSNKKNFNFGKRSRSGSHEERPVEEELTALRTRLRYHFTNFHKKYKHHKKKPWKFVLQILKIILISVQVGVFASSKQKVADFLNDNKDAMRNLFANGGSSSLYTTDSVKETIVTVTKQYYTIQRTVLGPYDYAWVNGSIPPLNLCIEAYIRGKIRAFNQTYDWSPKTTTKCHVLQNPAGDERILDNFLNTTITASHFDKYVKLFIPFSLKSVFLGSYKYPVCVQFNMQVTMDNHAHAGRVPLTMDMDPNFLDCNGNAVRTLDDLDASLNTFLDVLTLVVCFISAVLSIRSLGKTTLLMHRISVFLKKNSQHRLSWRDRLSLYDKWHFVTLFGDVVVIGGSSMKLLVELKEFEQYDPCAILLGLGALFVWIGCLRFLGYFRSYNVLLVTLQKAAPSLIRFMFCSGILYMAFCFCGWIVLGTHHKKFSSLIVTSETLFSLLNGDDMFTTFNIMPHTPVAIYVFSQVYLYVFISLFIYVVLSQFIALITDTYSHVLAMSRKEMDDRGHVLRLLDEHAASSRPLSAFSEDDISTLPASPTSGFGGTTLQGSLNAFVAERSDADVHDHQGSEPDPQLRQRPASSPWTAERRPVDAQKQGISTNGPRISSLSPDRAASRKPGSEPQSSHRRIADRHSSSEQPSSPTLTSGGFLPLVAVSINQASDKPKSDGQLAEVFVPLVETTTTHPVERASSDRELTEKSPAPAKRTDEQRLEERPLVQTLSEMPAPDMKSSADVEPPGGPI